MASGQEELLFGRLALHYKLITAGQVSGHCVLIHLRDFDAWSSAPRAAGAAPRPVRADRAPRPAHAWIDALLFQPFGPSRRAAEKRNGVELTTAKSARNRRLNALAEALAAKRRLPLHTPTQDVVDLPKMVQVVCRFQADELLDRLPPAYFVDPIALDPPCVRDRL
jgi:hypothetical protein